MLLKALLLAGTASASCFHDLVKREEGTVEFGYHDQIGAVFWGALDVSNEKCATGTVQSPININSTITKRSSEGVVINIENEQEFVFENRGTTVEVGRNGTLEPLGTTTLDGVELDIMQYHLHTPSEHHIGDEYYPLEAHMVHLSIDGAEKITVLAFLFELTESCEAKSNPIIDAIVPKLEDIQIPESHTEIESIDFAPLLEAVKSSELFEYTGSLTTPPCSEGVKFLIVEQPIDLSPCDYNKIKKLVKFNSRFIQNTNGISSVLEDGSEVLRQVSVLHAESSNATAKAETKPAEAADDDAAAQGVACEGGFFALIDEMSGTPLPTATRGCVHTTAGAAASASTTSASAPTSSALLNATLSLSVSAPA